jgi:hypothetical protein
MVFQNSIEYVDFHSDVLGWCRSHLEEQYARNIAGVMVRGLVAMGARHLAWRVLHAL